MRYLKMNYRGFEFLANPKTIKIQYSKNISQSTIPRGVDVCSQVSESPAIISGEGSFVGSNAIERAHRLTHIFNLKGSDFLFMPDAVPLKAFFKKLNIEYRCDENRVDYSFEFIQDCEKSVHNHNFDFTYADKDENLFDISNRTGIKVETLVGLNDFGDVFSVKEGEKVWLM